MDTTSSKNKTKIVRLLVITILVAASFLTMGLGPMGVVTIKVTSTADVLADDGACTLREAIIAANTNTPSGGMSGECPAGKPNGSDTITLTNGATYSLTIDSTGEDESANGDLDILDNGAGIDLLIKVEKGGTASLSQDASLDDRVLDLLGATVKIKGLTLSGGSNVDLGGGVHNTGGTLIMNASTISGNTANYGGGIYNDTSGTLFLTGSTVSGNTANVDGGGLENGGTLIVDASRISANSATYNGGGLFTYQGTATIQNGSIIGGDPSAGAGNVANLGGGMTVWSGGVTIDSSTVSGNSVSWDGGGVRIMHAGTLMVNASTIFGNSAVNAGGGLHNHGALRVETSEVSNNTASNGGGIGNDGGILTVTNSTISGNSVNWDGGGLLNWPNGMLTINASILSENSAGHAGGGFLNYGTLTMDTSTLHHNVTNEAGGGLFNLGTLAITSSTILGNISLGEGDAVYSAVDTVNATTVTNSCIVGNESTAAFNERSASQNFTGNWWGTASGPSGAGPGSGDSVGNNIDFSSWLTMPPDFCPTLWVAAFTYDLPAETLADGTYPYHFEFEWSVPESGAWTGQGGEFVVSSGAPVYDGYVLLRGPAELRGVDSAEGLVCEEVREINPNQSTRFLVGWLPDYGEMTYADALAHFESITASVVWGDGMSANLVR